MLRSILLFISLFSLLSCQGQSKVESKTYALMLRGLLSHSVPEVTASQAHEVKDKAIFLDAREEKEYQVSHIPNAIFVGYDKFDLEKVAHLAKDKKIVVYCSVGYRSEKITEQLLESGFKDVANLYGGIFEWKNKGYEVVNKDNQATEKVHAFDKTWGIWLKKGEKVY
ncbi:MAG: rhodanese-like domain-containing protein [Saprospiraceae bacterium]|nr:rhodanese-like domain-containing protein [Saprospiraceae bacterium]